MNLQEARFVFSYLWAEMESAVSEKKRSILYDNIGIVLLKHPEYFSEKEKRLSAPSKRLPRKRISDHNAQKLYTFLRHEMLSVRKDSDYEKKQVRIFEAICILVGKYHSSFSDPTKTSLIQTLQQNASIESWEKYALLNSK